MITSLISRQFLFALVTLVAVGIARAETEEGGEDTEEEVSVAYFKAHGWLMWIGYGTLMPLGIILSRHCQKLTTWWFHLHWFIQAVATACIVAGFTIGVKKFDALYESTHSKLGIAIFALTLLMPIMGAFRPKKGSNIRVTWYFFHFTFGTAIVIIAWYDIIKGLDLYEETLSVSLDTLKSWFATQIGVYSFIYLLLGRWSYLLSQKIPHEEISNGSLIKPNSADVQNTPEAV